MRKQLVFVSWIFVLALGCGQISNPGGAGGGAGSGSPGIDSGVGGGDQFAGGAAIRFGATMGKDGLVSNDPVDPNVRTVAAWQRMRESMVTVDRQMTAWSLEVPSPSTSYQLMTTAWHADQWESLDSAQGGFLFAPVDLGWWFVAETNDAADGGTSTKLYFKKEGDSALSMISGNSHASIAGVSRFIVGTDDANGQNRWMDGDLAGIKVWNAALTQSELELEATQLSPVRTANLHAFYPLQSVETMLHDVSGNGRQLVPATDGGSWSVQVGPAIPF